MKKFPEGFYFQDRLFYPNLKKYLCIKDFKKLSHGFKRSNFYYGKEFEDENSIVMHTHNSYKEGYGIRFSTQKNNTLYSYLNEYFVDFSNEERKKKLLKLKSPE